MNEVGPEINEGETDTGVALSTDKQIRLLATEFDGTLYGSSVTPEQYELFAVQLKQLRDRGAIWIVCSGRSRRLFQPPYRTFSSYDLRPEFAVLSNQLVYRAIGDRLIFDLWLTSRAFLRGLWCRISLPYELRRIAKLVNNHFPHVRALRVRAHRLDIMVSDDSVAHDVAAFMREETIDEPLIQVDEDRNVVEARISSLDKVVAVAEVQIARGISPQETLVIGAGLHDRSLMNESVGTLTGCPANATTRALRHVSQAGGHIARTPLLGGAAECIAAHLSGEILSTPPGGAFGAHPSLSTIKEQVRQHAVSGQGRKLEMAVIVAAVGVGLLVLASFGLLPFSRIIMKPFYWIMRVLGDALAH